MSEESRIQEDSDTTLEPTVIPRLLIAMLLLSTPGCSPGQRVPSAQADNILVEKSARLMTVRRGNTVLKSYRIALGTQPIGAKDREGDHKTPEGKYFVDAKKNPSRFYLALHLSYPSVADRERARRNNVKPGSDVEIHGLGREFGFIGPAHRLRDWTDGCIAVTNSEIEEIYAMVPVGAMVEILP